MHDETTQKTYLELRSDIKAKKRTRRDNLRPRAKNTTNNTFLTENSNYDYSSDKNTANSFMIDQKSNNNKFSCLKYLVDGRLGIALEDLDNLVFKIISEILKRKIHARDNPIQISGYQSQPRSKYLINHLKKPRSIKRTKLPMGVSQEKENFKKDLSCSISVKPMTVNLFKQTS